MLQNKAMVIQKIIQINLTNLLNFCLHFNSAMIDWFFNFDCITRAVIAKAKHSWSLNFPWDIY